MYQRLSVLSSLAVAAGWALAGCSSGTETDNPAAPGGIELLRADAAYVVDPEVSDADAELLGQAQLGFSLDLYRGVASSAPAGSNLMVAPYSAQTTLTMLYAGARGQTATQMADVLHIAELGENVHPAMNALSQALRVAAGEGATLDVYSSHWVDLGFAPKTPFLEILSAQYDSGVYRADFAGDPEGSRRAINEWVTEQTHGLIEELFERGTIMPETKLAISNTVYFAARWAYPFSTELTRIGEFTLASGDTVQTELMSGQEDLAGVVEDEYRAVRLPYADSTTSMVAVLPSEGTFDAFEAGLDAARLSSILDAFEAGETVDVVLPKFNFDTPIDLKPVLKGLGMVDAFGLADFSGIGEGELFLNAAVQKTSIAVDEAGTVAAGATGLAVGALGMTEVVDLTRPFLFFIMDDVTRTVLFAGRLMVPPQG